jgi:hypothetical protein
VTEHEEMIVGEFLDRYYPHEFAPGDIAAEVPTIEAVMSFVAGSFARMKYPLGLAFDFVTLSQRLSIRDAAAISARPQLTVAELFTSYPRVIEKNGRVQNTLTVTFAGTEFGIRKLEEELVDLLLRLSRPGYPSAYVYNTGQWHKFQDALLAPCFRLSESARYVLTRRLIEFALANLTVGTPLGRATARIRLFEEILESYPRSARGEKAGSVFQALACGYMTADRGHLSLVVDKTRTGSARQARLGDIDGYYGMDLELAIEVKDQPIVEANLDTELGDFLQKVQSNHVMGLAFVRSAEPAAVARFAEAGAACLTAEIVQSIVTTWDWQKQDIAVNATLHFLAHIEQNPDATRRLLLFIKSLDPQHESLHFLVE